MTILWQLTGVLDGATVNASWDGTGLRADPALYEAVMDREGTVQATPTGPSFPAGLDTPDQAWATVWAVLDDVTDAVGDPPGYPWGVPEGAVDG